MNLTNINFTEIAFLFAMIIVAITVHEFSHALAAYLLGDSTAKQQGRLTLNPIAHLDPMGTIMMIITLIGGVGIGWGKPVPVNPHNMRVAPKTGMALSSFAGPLSNFVLATIVATFLRLRIYPDNELLIGGMVGIIQISVVLGIFNLIPLPPLDGFSVLLGLLPDRQAISFARLATYGPGVLLAIIFGGYILRIDFLGFIIRPPLTGILSLLLPGVFRF